MKSQAGMMLRGGASYGGMGWSRGSGPLLCPSAAALPLLPAETGEDHLLQVPQPRGAHCAYNAQPCSVVLLHCSACSRNPRSSCPYGQFSQLVSLSHGIQVFSCFFIYHSRPSCSREQGEAEELGEFL